MHKAIPGPGYQEFSAGPSTVRMGFNQQEWGFDMVCFP